MSSFFIVSLSPEYLGISKNLKENLNSKNRIHNSQVITFMEKLIDSVITIVMEDMLKNVPMGKLSKKAVHQMGNLAKKTLISMYSRLISKLRSEELKPFLDYFQNMEMEIGGKIFLAIPIEEKSFEQSLECFADFDKKELRSVQKLLIDFTNEFVPILLNVFINDATRLLKLGLIVRKLVDVAYVTILKASHVATPQVFKGMDYDSVKAYQSFVGKMFYRE